MRKIYVITGVLILSCLLPMAAGAAAEAPDRDLPGVVLDAGPVRGDRQVVFWRVDGQATQATRRAVLITKEPYSAGERIYIHYRAGKLAGISHK